MYLDKRIFAITSSRAHHFAQMQVLLCSTHWYSIHWLKYSLTMFTQQRLKLIMKQSAHGDGGTFNNQINLMHWVDWEKKNKNWRCSFDLFLFLQKLLHSNVHVNVSLVYLIQFKMITLPRAYTVSILFYFLSPFVLCNKFNQECHRVGGCSV